MICTTLSDYKANYQANLEAFIKGYEDNTESIFLQNELEKYNNLLEILINHKATSVSFGFQKFGFQTLGEYYNSLELKNIGIDLEKPENYITSTKRIIGFITEEIDSKSVSVKTIKKVGDAKYKSTIWFKVGLLFANGEVQRLYKKYKSEKGHFKKITLELGFKETDRPYFSETINNSTKSPKNIYKSSKNMNIIFDFCLRNNISINDDFMSIYNALQKK